MMDLDVDHLRTWIGRTESSEDIVTSRLAAEFVATFSPHLAPVAPGEAPLGIHWCLAPAIKPMAELGPDGHPARGGFLPPIPLPRRMWAGGRVEAISPIRVGDTVVRRSRIGDVSLKEGRTGPLCFVAVHHDYETPRGLAVSERHDIVYREAASGAVSPSPPVRADPRPADRDWTVETSPTFLFRYSAITFNGHRIHYDLPYATGIEGYAGLVFHGPIQATLLYNLTAAIEGRPPSQFDYRGLSPVTSGPPIRAAVAKGAAGEVRGWTESVDGRVCMESQARV